MAYEERKQMTIIAIILIGVVFLVRLFYLQVINDSFRLSAENNVLRFVTVYPERGLLFDRNGKLLVLNTPSYDLMAIPKKIAPFDTNLLCEKIHISKQDLKTQLQKAKRYSRYKASAIVKMLTSEEYSYIGEHLYEFPGFFLQKRLVCSYTDSIAPHLLGYIQEISGEDLKRHPDYGRESYVGKTGVEKSYDSILRGKKGVRIYQVDVHNRIQGHFADGLYDTIPQRGKNLTLTIDKDLQKYAERLLRGKRGSIVALIPKTGEVLVFASSPTYNPNLLMKRNHRTYYHQLIINPDKPLFNRALSAKYPPGSTFKVANALVGLKFGLLTPNTYYSCNYGYTAGGLHVGCHGHKSPLNLKESIMISCNAYYCNVFRSILEHNGNLSVEQSYKKWRSAITSFGFAHTLGVDLPNESSGFIPNTFYYDRYYGKGHWSGLTIISMAIGQGEVLATPIQLANFATTVANRGYYKIPHVVKRIENEKIDKKYTIPHYTHIDTSYYEDVIEGMYLAVNGPAGATAHIAHIDSLDVCGKTGTAQNPHGENHSVFMAFAPRKKPKIAIAVIIENGGYGSSIAAPIASLVIEKYINDTIASKRKYLETYVENYKVKKKK